MELKEKKLYLLDMDGTIYLDEQLFPKIPELLQLIRERGGRYLFLTNNSSRGIEGYLQKMARLGIPAQAEDFLTSVDAAVYLLRRDYPGKLVYALGTESFAGQLRQAGIPLLTDLGETEEEIREALEKTELLLVGFDRELKYKKLQDASRLLLAKPELIYLAANPDWVCPTAFGCEPDCGSICELLSHVNGRHPQFIGKPERTMADLALVRTGYSAEETVIVGDRIYTDIACGIKAGIDSLFVLSGEGTEADKEKYGIYPRWTYGSLAEVYEEIR